MSSRIPRPAKAIFPVPDYYKWTLSTLEQATGPDKPVNAVTLVTVFAHIMYNVANAEESKSLPYNIRYQG
jgi:hypothetical protein